MGSFITEAGISHLHSNREEFQAQVPPWLPLLVDAVVLASGVVEIALGTGLLVASKRRRLFGTALAAFYVAIFPGNIAQYRERRDAFGLDTDGKRLARLFFQAPLIAGALAAAVPEKQAA